MSSSMASIFRRRNSGHWTTAKRILITRKFSSRSPEEWIPSVEKILIANRGEIACRIMRTAKRLGIRTVAVFSDADKDSVHVRMADEAVRIGPPPARLSYLNSSAIVEAARRTGAQAVHPGYGFLSESAEFAQICEDEGLMFIGPPVSAIRDMGDKSASKRIMGAAGVPLVPGYHGDEQDTDLLKAEADKIGYPVLIKPTHGGGGKGMRIVQGPGDLIEAVLGAQREATASFGVNTLLLEKYITRPRHIEVQIFGDKHGNVIHLYERDCSVQRRHQKIIEEAPAPNVMHEFRTQLGEAAVSAAKAVGYYNAGTVEFIVDTSTNEFYFMEMNTRLQVEHPVTEMIVAQDLVEWQIHVTNGGTLPLSQSEVPLIGHAFEARIYAENVPKGFLPAVGTLHHYHPVQCSQTVRVETGVEEGDSVSVHYDPMIAKLVVLGANRSAALVNLKHCLSDFQVAGVPTNISFLKRLANHWAFMNGQVETHFIDQFRGDLLPDTNDTAAAKLSAVLVAACMCEKEHLESQNRYKGKGSLSLWYAAPPFRMHHQAKREMELDWDTESPSGSTIPVKLYITYQSDGTYLIQVEDSSSPGMVVSAVQTKDLDFRVDVDGHSEHATLAFYSTDRVKHIHVWHDEHHCHFTQTSRPEPSSYEGAESRSSQETVRHSQGTVLAPMSGLVIKVLVENEATVKEGQPVLVLEAMKMEHIVKAPCAGKISGLQVTPGMQVFDSTVLFTIKDG